MTYNDGTATTVFPNKFYEKTGTKTTKHIYAGNDLLASVESTGGNATTYTVHTDHLGGTNVVTDQSGALNQTLSYYPFGSTRINAKQGSFDERKKFTGHQFDDAAGLYYMNARYQEPRIGRFVSEDPSHLALGDTKQLKQLIGQDQQTYLADPQQLNSYSYVASNPLSRTDPTGNAFGVDDAAGFLVGGVVGVSMQAGISLATGQGMTWGDVGGAFVSGGIVGVGAANAPETGGLSVIVAASLVGGTAGFVGNGIKQGIDIKTGAQQGGFNSTEFAVSGVGGAVTAGVLEGTLPLAKIPGLSSGKGNMNAIGKGLQTKLANGVIKNISFTSGVKSAVGSQAANGYKTLGGTMWDMAKPAAVSTISVWQQKKPAR